MGRINTKKKKQIIVKIKIAYQSVCLLLTSVDPLLIDMRTFNNPIKLLHYSNFSEERYRRKIGPQKFFDASFAHRCAALKTNRVAYMVSFLKLP